MDMAGMLTPEAVKYCATIGHTSTAIQREEHENAILVKGKEERNREHTSFYGRGLIPTVLNLGIIENQPTLVSFLTRLSMKVAMSV